LLSLDAPINNYLKRWKISENELTIETPVTLRMLLTHTGGLTVTGFSGYKQTDKIPTTVQILNGETPANTEAVFVDIKPNTEWRYSGGGYTVAQLAMEDVTGLKYPEIIKICT
ncbi:MAG: beta-lactamase family protein, partial [Kordiimonadaceae bacterium]|nr:beta-lactamase family protein [Kordiimonadaceae bacterium]